MAIADFTFSRTPMSIVSSLIGRKPVQEFTGVAAIPAVAMPVGVQAKQKRLAGTPPKPEDKKKKLKEDGLIPDDATPLSPESGTPAEDTELAGAEDGNPEPTPQPEEVGTDLLPTSLALVAPDSTPGWNVPLSPTQLPKSATPAPAAQPPSPAPAAPAPATAPTDPKDVQISVESMLGLGRAARSQPAKPGAAVPSPVQETFTPKSGDDLIGQGKPMPEPTASNSSSGLLKRFNFGG